MGEKVISSTKFASYCALGLGLPPNAFAAIWHGLPAKYRAESAAADLKQDVRVKELCSVPRTPDDIFSIRLGKSFRTSIVDILVHLPKENGTYASFEVNANCDKCDSTCCKLFTFGHHAVVQDWVCTTASDWFYRLECFSKTVILNNAINKIMRSNDARFMHGHPEISGIVIVWELKNNFRIHLWTSLQGQVMINVHKHPHYHFFQFEFPQQFKVVEINQEQEFVPHELQPDPPPYWQPDEIVTTFANKDECLEALQSLITKEIQPEYTNINHD